MASKCQKKKDSSGKRPISDKRSKTADLIIHKEITVAPGLISTNSIYKKYQPLTVPGIKIEPHNIRYLLERQRINWP